MIVDAIHAKVEGRAAIAALARDCSTAFHGLWMEALAETLLGRVAARTGDASDAMPDVVRRQLTCELGDNTWRNPDASAAPSATLAVAERSLANPDTQP